MSAATFALLHQHLPAMAQLFIVGFVLAYLYERTGSLVASMAAHAANNLYSLVMIYLLARGGM